MASRAGLIAAVLGLASGAAWGVGDFGGGLAARRGPVLAVTLWSQVVGLGMLTGLAILRGERALAGPDAFWGGLAGLAGVVGLLSLYRALAIGEMGVAAPVTSVLSASLPVLVGTVTQGFPGPRRLFGFTLALAGIWLIARPADAGGRPAGLGLAVLGGLGFGGFLVLIARVGSHAVFWPLAAARATSVATLLAVTLVRGAGGGPRSVRGAWGPIALAGTMDGAGNALFVLAEQAGRLDVAGTLSSLYPATTVLLARWLLGERLRPPQTGGVVLALLAVPLIAA